MKIYTNGQCHISKMAAMPVKKRQKSSSPEPVG